VSYLNKWHTMITDELADRWVVTGSAAEVAETLLAYQDAGVNIFQLIVASPNQREQMRRIGEQVLPLMN
jgi:alkanesulfonate monooxygenase SsuD/methylene tetrahydromethanopterin reductase-like flavin-dependent oxidoreductase (luciferase family)